MDAYIHKGSVAPNVLEFTADATDSGGVDLTDVTAAVLMVRKPNGTEATWTGDIDPLTWTADNIDYEYEFAADDLDQEGVYRIFMSMTVPTGTIRTEVIKLHVLHKYWELPQ